MLQSSSDKTSRTSNVAGSEGLSATVSASSSLLIKRYEQPPDASRLQQRRPSGSQSQEMKLLQRSHIRRPSIGADFQPRGVPSNILLRNCGALFARGNAAQTIDTYTLSVPTRRLDCFVSHSWRASRWGKWMACLFIWHTGPACIGGCLSASVVFLAYHALGFKGYDPGRDQIPPLSLDNWAWLNQHWVKCPFGCTLIGSLVFLSFFFFGHRVTRKKQCFLDICCIDQASVESKQQGILKLGAYLNCSDNFIVLYDPSYFTRSWTVFELACYCRLSSLQKIHFVPLSMPVWVIGNFLGECIAILVGNGPWFNDPALSAFWTSTLGLVCCGFAMWSVAIFSGLYFYHSAMDDRASIEGLTEFSFEQTACYSAEDRQNIRDCIASWYAKEGDLDTEDPETQYFAGLQNFEKFVREDVREVLLKTGGCGSRVPFHYFMLTQAPWMWFLFGDYQISVRGSPMQEAEWTYGISFCLLWNWGAWPLYYIFLGWFTEVFVVRLKRFLPLGVVLFLCTLALATVPSVVMPVIMSLAGFSGWAVKFVVLADLLGVCVYFYGNIVAGHNDYEIRAVESPRWESIPMGT